MVTTNVYEKLMWFFTVLLFVMFSVMRVPYGGVAVGIVLILIFFFYAAQHNMRVRVRFTYMHSYILIFTGYVALSSLWAIVPGYATRRVEFLLETMFLVVILYTCYQDEGGVDRLLKILMWRGHLVLLYVVVRYGISSIIYMLRNDIRVDNDILNANSLGLMVSYSIIINFYYILKQKKIKITDLMIIPAFLMLAVSGSRKGLVLAAGGITAVVILRSWDNRQVVKSIIKIICGGIILIVLGIIIIQLPFMQGIMRRMDDLFLLLTGKGNSSGSAYVRFEYIKLGIQLFKDHPIIGIGIDNARVYTIELFGYDHYLHNNYVELLACGGIIGTALYYWIYVYLLLTFGKYKNYRNGEFDICLILLVLALVMEYGMVTYESRETYYMLLLYCLEVDKLRKNYKESKVINSAIIGYEYGEAR